MTAMADRRPNGFTLLELLVALTVLGFLLVGLAQGVHFGLLAWGTEVRLTSGNDDFNTLDSTLRHMIEGADPGDDLDPAPFVGSRDRLDCITALPDAAGPTGAGACRQRCWSIPATGWCCAGALSARDTAAGTAVADRNRIAARRVADGAGVLAARQRLGQFMAFA